LEVIGGYYFLGSEPALPVMQVLGGGITFVGGRPVYRFSVARLREFLVYY